MLVYTYSHIIIWRTSNVHLMNSSPSNTYFVVIGFRLQLVHLEQIKLILGELELLYGRSKVEIFS